jgi:sugar O-acyltransferase (sialic acid O-acetyltransferase NeuD family)
MSKNVLILGGHGTGSVIANALVHANSIGYDEYIFKGFLNDQSEENIAGFPVLGKFKDASRFANMGYTFIYTAYKIGFQKKRIDLLNSFNIPEDQWATFIHPFSYVAPDTFLSPGCVVMPGATISSHVNVGLCTLIMSNVSIGHDNKISNYCFFTSNSCTGSYIEMDEGVWIGLNSTLRGRLHIGKYSAIGMGAVVTKSVGENELWVGNPAKFHKNVNDKITY